MDNFIIEGGHELFGEVNISGAKNAAVAIIPAAILADDVVRIENIPAISDVSLIIKILDSMGAGIKMINKNTIEVDSRSLKCQSVPYELTSCFRASYYLIGAMLGRRWLCPAVATSACGPLTCILRALNCWVPR